MFELKEKNFPEKKENLPEVEIKFAFTSHMTAEDAAVFKKNLKGSDLIFLEGEAYPHKYKEDYQKLALGEMTPKEFNQKWTTGNVLEFEREIDNLLYNSQKTVFFPDVPAGHESLKSEKLIHQIYLKSYQEFAEGNFEKAIAVREMWLKNEARSQKDREKIIRENIKRILAGQIKSSKKFQAKKKLKALVSMGEAHTGIFRKLKQELGKNIKEEFGQMPIIFGIEAIIIRALMFDKTKKIPRREIAKTFIERPLFNYLVQVESNTNKIYQVIRTISTDLDYQTIKELSQKMGTSDQSLDQRIEQLENLVVNFLEEKGIKIPKTKKEINQYQAIKK